MSSDNKKMKSVLEELLLRSKKTYKFNPSAEIWRRLMMYYIEESGLYKTRIHPFTPEMHVFFGEKCWKIIKLAFRKKNTIDKSSVHQFLGGGTLHEDDFEWLGELVKYCCKYLEHVPMWSYGTIKIPVYHEDDEEKPTPTPTIQDFQNVFDEENLHSYSWFPTTLTYYLRVQEILEKDPIKASGLPPHVIEDFNLIDSDALNGENPKVEYKHKHKHKPVLPGDETSGAATETSGATGATATVEVDPSI